MAGITFDILQYMSGLTGFTFSKENLVSVAFERGVAEVTSYEELTTKQKDLIKADLLLIAYLSPNMWASYHQAHGSYSKQTGNQSMTDATKEEIYQWLFGIYTKYDDPKLEELTGSGATVNFLDI